MTNPKVVLAFGVWVVYALALHSPINPAFRGRKSAMLSIVGFVLMMLATVIAVQFMPDRQ
jgi:ABC-type transport system involved in cytochrome c biogenesis permease subunit